MMKVLVLYLNTKAINALSGICTTFKKKDARHREEVIPEIDVGIGSA